MKKTIYIALLVTLIPTLCLAGALQKKLCGVIGKKNTAESSCNAASDQVGVRATGASNATIAPQYMYCNLATADCSGDLGYAYLYHSGTNDDDAYVCIYTYDSDPPDVGDKKYKCTALMDASSSQGWIKSAAKLTGTVNNGTTYFVCVLGGTKAWQYAYDGGAVTLYYEGTFASGPPDDLTAVDTWDTTTRTMSVYVEIE